MDLIFERGRSDAPSGHALVYFANPVDGATLATYLVVLPISLQLTKYIPPMLAAQLPIADVKNVGAVPLPPVPEPVESREYLERLADLRRDDLIAGGKLNPSDLARAMTVISEVAQRYAQLYEDGLAREPLPGRSEPVPDQISDVSASDVIYDLMSEQQKLAELAKLAGQVRYAVDGGDGRQVADLVADVERLGRHLPATYDLENFIAAAKRPGSLGQQLSSLYLDRCYKLANEDYGALAAIDREIERLRAGT
jgi:hypothetical protein